VGRLLDVTFLFLRLGATAFGGPAAHVALFERECVERRRWISRARFLDLLGIANLIPGPTSTELAMHIGREHAGWPGLVLGGIAFILPASLVVTVLAALYTRLGALPETATMLATLQPVVCVVILQALLPLGRSAIRSVPMGMLAVAVALLALAGIPEIRILLLAGAVHALLGRPMVVVALAVCLAGSAGVVAMGAGAAGVGLSDIGRYFLQVGAVLFGSGYVLLPVLEGGLVERQQWLTRQELSDAIAAGQVTPGPLFTTATFVGYLLGGVSGAIVATTAIFLPAFVFSALSSSLLDRLRRSEALRTFLEGVNGAAVGLIAVTLLTLAQTAFTGAASIVTGLLAAAALFWGRLNPALVLAVSALLGVARALT
jgi:chromate transporter